MNKLINGHLHFDNSKKCYIFPFNAYIIDTVTRKKKRVYVHNQKELDVALSKKVK